MHLSAIYIYIDICDWSGWKVKTSQFLASLAKHSSRLQKWFAPLPLNPGAVCIWKWTQITGSAGRTNCCRSLSLISVVVSKSMSESPNHCTGIIHTPYTILINNISNWVTHWPLFLYKYKYLGNSTLSICPGLMLWYKNDKMNGSSLYISMIWFMKLTHRLSWEDLTIATSEDPTVW